MLSVCYMYKCCKDTCKCCNLYMPVCLWLQMVFADRNTTISGGNFHGEYPAKVKYITLLYMYTQ